MKQEQFTWLISCADRLNAGMSLPIDLEHIVHEMGIEVRRERSVATKKAGAALRKTDGTFQICVYPHRVPHRERFTLAHELAHVLLEAKYSWNPSSRSEYYLREEWCNQFASRLLIPEATIRRCNADNPQAALRSVLWVSRTCRVSKEAAARRLTSAYPGPGVAELSSELDGAGNLQVRVWWAAPELPDQGLRRFKVLRKGHPVVAAIASSPDCRSFVVKLAGADGLAFRSKRAANRFLLWTSHSSLEAEGTSQRNLWNADDEPV